MSSVSGIDAPDVPGDAKAASARISWLIGRVHPLAILLGWTALVLLMAAGHEMWRDEVRALSLAIDPPTLTAMLEGLRGEGHPALWYLILRASHQLTGSVLVLPVCAFLAAAAGMAFLILRSPFHPGIKILLACSAFLAVEYPVLARNYGISLLPMFVFAAYYDRWRERGVGLGITLFLLTNTNVHSAIVAIALLGMWLVEVLRENGFRRSRPLAVYLVNAAVAGAGLLLAVAIVRGPANDAITSSLPRSGLADALLALVHPGPSFQAMAPTLPSLALTLLLFGSLLALARRPALLLAGCGALLLFALLFTVGYPGQYRHVGIWLAFLLSLCWIAELRDRRDGADADRWLPRLGRICLLAVLVLQVGLGVGMLAESLRRPWSGSAGAATWLKAHPRYADAILIAEPDFNLEPFPYYGFARTYLLREQRFGHAVNFTRAARLELSLGEMLETGRRLKRETGAEVVALVPTELELDPAAPARRLGSGYNWIFTTSPDDVRAFLAGTERLARFDRSLQGEDYVLYRLR